MRDLSKTSEKDQKAAAEYMAKRDQEKTGPRPRSNDKIPPVVNVRNDADRAAEDKALRDLMRPNKPRG